MAWKSLPLYALVHTLFALLLAGFINMVNNELLPPKCIIATVTIIIDGVDSIISRSQCNSLFPIHSIHNIVFSIIYPLHGINIQQRGNVLANNLSINLCFLV